MSHRPRSPQPLLAPATLVGLVSLFLTVPAGPASAQTPTEMIQEQVVRKGATYRGLLFTDWAWFDEKAVAAPVDCFDK